VEVLPDFQGQGIGQRLMTRMLDRLGHLPNVDLLCDPDVVPFYERFGMKSVGGHGVAEADGVNQSARPDDGVISGEASR
jgi:predicted N-acetyltransferase YhbS